MHNLALTPLFHFFLYLGLFQLPLMEAQIVNGLLTCAKECALEFINNSDCPLSNSTCICNYVSYYDTCVEKECNGTDIAGANEPPVPYYIPDATISISIIPSCSLSTPNFRKPTQTTLPSEGEPTVTMIVSGTASAVETEEPMSSSSEKETFVPKTTQALESTFERQNSSTPSPGSGGNETISTSTSEGGQQTSSTPAQRQTTAMRTAMSTTSATTIDVTSAAHANRLAAWRIVVPGILGLAIAVL